MKVHLELDTKTMVRFWLVIFGLVVVGYMIYIAQTAFVLLGIAGFLALALNVPVSKVVMRFPKRSRLFAAGMAYLAIVIFLAAVVFLVIPPVVDQTASFVQTVPNLIQSNTSKWQGLQTIITRYNLQPQLDAAYQSIQSSATSWAGHVGSSLISGIGSLFSFATATLLVLVLTFLILIEGPTWKARFFALYGDENKRKHHMKLAKELQSVVAGYVTGQMTVSAIGAFFAGLTVFVISRIFGDIPSNLAFSAVAINFVFSLIPLFGATIGGLLIAALLMFSTPIAAVIYLIYFVIYQQIENNFIAPHIQSKRLNLSALSVLVSITIGIYMFGLLGALVAIPIAGALRVLVDEYIVNINEKKRQPKSVNVVKA